MGMFDNLKCSYPLPVEGANSFEYQTKDTPAQFLDLYEIRDDGTLWHETYDTEDQSERAKWIAANPDKPETEAPSGLSSFLGCMARINQKWEQVTDFTGEIVFYHIHNGEGSWIEWSAYLESEKVSRVNLIENRP